MGHVLSLASEKWTQSATLIPEGPRFKHFSKRSSFCVEDLPPTIKQRLTEILQNIFFTFRLYSFVENLYLLLHQKSLHTKREKSVN